MIYKQVKKYNKTMAKHTNRRKGIPTSSASVFQPPRTSCYAGADCV